jgi:SAM-dependent methyltransferase
MGVLKNRIKWWLFPGINLHSRLRYERLPKLFGSSQQRERVVLDAGCGNGMLAYRAWAKGNRVIGVTFKESEVRGCRALFNGYLGIPEAELSFRQGNLYELDFPDMSCDEIICAEVLEHLRRDEEVCRRFWELLKPGGILHVCAPNARHPYNENFPLDKNEQGGHVRPGYTAESYRQLLEPIGYEVGNVVPLGGPVRQAFSRRIKESQERYGPLAGFPWFLASLVFLPFENPKLEREVPFSIYLQARRRLRDHSVV